jgi:AraC family transcriptional regulator, transcriptional activator of the genes for pyochelin and ferripyochelin receptors
MNLSVYDIECIQRAKDFIDADVTRHHSIQEIATYSGISATRLKEGFKSFFGKGLFQYLKDKRLQQGKYLIENTDKTLLEISRGLGYRHVCNFISAFKKKFGKPPGMWRKRVICRIINFHWINYFDIDHSVPELLLQAGIFIG